MVLSRSSQKFILSVLTSYSRTTQIILFTNPSSVIGNKFLVTHLPDDFKKSYSPISYRYQINNEYSLTPGKQTTKNNQEVQTPIIVRYVKDSVLNEEEYRYVEFKEVKGENPIRSILSLVDQYVVAYLNERIKQFPGRIIWGVTDKERKVVGVNLDYKQRDELRKSITDRLSQIQPPIPLSSYQIDIKKVHDSNLNYIEDIYIVEVIIEKNNSNYLFATPKGEVYIKTDGGKQKLSHFQVQEEILFRNKRNTGFHN
ncbi:hypothetical protein BK702_03735 [Bacillus thuringiensis serovar cameroun]|nr:hypothetical protein BK702_03735 [Bacillus thuringiensis serovar cameroun]